MKSKMLILLLMLLISLISCKTTEQDYVTIINPAIPAKAYYPKLKWKSDETSVFITIDDGQKLAEYISDVQIERAEWILLINYYRESIGALTGQPYDLIELPDIAK